ncbi:MAG: hypothetical protein KJ697_03280 [Nanoarchaeota archaeon]|nr:hypothetical protein [Nanoarchaeota archaeon]MBU4124061.1 hypothetical protein [Nanoarchaeota archaeon]
MFWNKKKDDVQEIKDAVEPSQPVFTRPTEIPEIRKIEMPSMQEPKNFAPLYIKIDKYKEVLQRVQKLKTILSNLSALARLEGEVEKIASQIEANEKKNLDEFSGLLNQLDQELVRPQSFEPFIKDNSRPIDGNINQMESELKEIGDRTENI